MNCRGHIKRMEIVEKYEITPIAHIKLLNGRIIPSDAGGDIEDSYFIFNCKSKSGEKDEVIYCGRPTAKDFCDITNQKLPKLFNPLRENLQECENVRQSTIRNNFEKSRWNPVRKQLYNATMLIIAVWNAKPNTPLFTIKSELETYIEYEPYLKRIKAINTMLRNSGTTLLQIIDELSEENDIKEYNFDLLIERLNSKDIKQYFEKE